MADTLVTNRVLLAQGFSLSRLLKFPFRPSFQQGHRPIPISIGPPEIRSSVANRLAVIVTSRGWIGAAGSQPQGPAVAYFQPVFLDNKPRNIQLFAMNTLDLLM